MQVEGKVILVTGAGSGIGRELTRHLLEKGARVAGVDLNGDSLQETARDAGNNGSRFVGCIADITDRAAVEDLPRKVLQHFGCIDGIINNAGVIQPFVRVVDLEYSTIAKVMNVNFFGALHVTKTFLPHLLKRPEAHIVNVSSMGGVVPVPGQTIYGAAKAAVKLMTEGLAAELIDTNVKVSVVIPGAVVTNILANSGLKLPPMPEAKSGGAMRGLSASAAARIIVRGIERNDYHIMVGKDAKMASWFYRFRPAFASRTIAKKMRSLLPAT